MTIIDFNAAADITNWVVTDDVVMGGCSQGSFSISEQGYGLFHGNVSLENNGGFSSVRYPFHTINVDGFSKLLIRARGDGNAFQVRVKTSTVDRYAYTTVFETSCEWTTMEIPFAGMYPVFRGRQLDIPNYPGRQMEEIAFLIGNKKATTFKLEIEKLWLSS